MPSKQITDRQKSALAVSAAIRTHATDAERALHDQLAPYLKKGETMPNIALLLELSARSLDAAAATMIASDESHLRELADDDAPRRNRDTAAAALSDELVILREWLTGLFGHSALRALGFSAETPTDPVALERFAGEVQSALQDKSLPKPRQKGISWDPTETRAQLAKARAALQGHLQDVAREARDAEGTLRAKNDAMNSYDQRFSRVATFVSGLFRFAGETALAERVRPSGRKPGQTAESDGEAPNGGSSAPSAG